jgi:hypothetical protein
VSVDTPERARRDVGESAGGRPEYVEANQTVKKKRDDLTEES